MCREKQKLELNFSQGKQVLSANVSVPAHKDPRLESINLRYGSIDSDDYVIPALDTDGNQFSSKSSKAAVTSMNNPPIVDNPAYCTSSDPSLTVNDNPDYIALKSDSATTAVSHHSNN